VYKENNSPSRLQSVNEFYTERKENQNASLALCDGRKLYRTEKRKCRPQRARKKNPAPTDPLSQHTYRTPSMGNCNDIEYIYRSEIFQIETVEKRTDEGHQGHLSR